MSKDNWPEVMCVHNNHDIKDCPAIALVANGGVIINGSDSIVTETAAYAKGKEDGRLEAQEEVKWIIAALCMRDPKRRVRIAWRDVLAVPQKARLEKFEDTTGQAVVYRLREEE